jgi:hypothetical protein
MCSVLTTGTIVHELRHILFMEMGNAPRYLQQEEGHCDLAACLYFCSKQYYPEIRNMWINGPDLYRNGLREVTSTVLTKASPLKASSVLEAMYLEHECDEDTHSSTAFFSVWDLYVHLLAEADMMDDMRASANFPTYRLSLFIRLGLKAYEERTKAKERSKAVEERAKAVEERAKAVEERVKAAEKRVKAAEERVKAAEERVKAARKLNALVPLSKATSTALLNFSVAKKEQSVAIKELSEANRKLSIDTNALSTIMAQV